MEPIADTGQRSAKLTFHHDGRPGIIEVSCTPDREPAESGKPEHPRGFPACTASLEFEGIGYDAFFGWIQFVRSSDNSTGGRGFDLDPLGWYPDARNPYAFFGLLPKLFDAPSRSEPRKMSWLAHSFLCVTPMYDERERILHLRQVLAISGFSWGFDIDEKGEFAYPPIGNVESQDWNAQLPTLRKAYRSWKFPEVARFE
jgi:hypothetical protein